MINEISELLEGFCNWTLWSSRLAAIRSRLRRKKKTRPETLVAMVGCSGCYHKPLMSFDDQRRSYHLTCVNPKCPAPKWTDAQKRNRDLRETVREWFEINGVSSN